MGLNRPPAVVVVGSMNIDLIAYARRAPGPGETVIGDRFQSGFGGKGANQAAMARLLGADVSFVGALGDDLYATMTLENFARLGVHSTGVHARDRIERGRADLGGGGRHEPDHRRPRRERPRDTPSMLRPPSRPWSASMPSSGSSRSRRQPRWRGSRLRGRAAR